MFIKGFEHLQRYKAIIVSTQQQKADVIERIKGVIPVYAIPVGYSSIEMNDDSNKNNYVLPKKLFLSQDTHLKSN